MRCGQASRGARDSARADAVAFGLMNGPSLSLEGYARVRAEMEAGHLRDGVLARAGVSLDDWGTIQLEWLEKMGAEIEHGRFDLTNRYAQAFVERQSEIASPSRGAAPQVAPEVQSPPAHAAPQVVEPGLAAPAFASPSIVEMGAIPTYAAAAPLPGTLQAPAPVAMSAPPQVPAPVAMSAPPAAAPSVKAPITETRGFDVSVIRAALPFMKSAPPAAPTAPAAAGQAATTPPLAGGQGASATPPLAGGQAPAAAPRSAAEAPRGGPASVLDSTAGLPRDLVERIRRAELPFARSKANLGGAATKAPGAPAPAPVAPAGAAPPGAPAGAALPGAPAAAAPPVPPGGAAQPADGQSAAARLTLEQYAALCAELAAAPQATDAVFTRYGLVSSRDRSEADLSWRERLRHNPVEYRLWQEHYQRYQAYWQERARRGPGA